MHRILGNISCDLGQRSKMYFLVNASSSKPLDAATSTFAGAQVICYREHWATVHVTFAPKAKVSYCVFL